MIWYQALLSTVLVPAAYLTGKAMDDCSTHFFLYCLHSIVFPICLLLVIIPRQQWVRQDVIGSMIQSKDCFDGQESNPCSTEKSIDIKEAIASRKWTDVLVYITFNPKNLAEIGAKRKPTALHHACLFQAPAHIIEQMLFQVPELAVMSNAEGEIPLHWAIRLGLSNQILRMLLMASPASGVYAKDNDGNTPLSLVWGSHQKSLLQLWWSGKEKLEHSLAWKRIVMLLTSCYYGEVHHPPVTNSNILLIAARYPCPPALFPLLLQVYDDNLDKDDNGETVLAAACSDPVGNRHCDIQTKIELILAHERALTTVQYCDRSRRVPFFIAIASGIYWDEGIKTLLRADPKFISSRDPVTGFYPFLLASAEGKQRVSSQKKHIFDQHLENQEDQLLNTIYCLLRADPAQLQCCQITCTCKREI